MTPDPIIEKIKKLLRMKRGGTPGEIENALAMAAKLARAHGIDLASVNPDEEISRPITHEQEIMGLRIPLEAKHAANICVRFFNVQVCFSAAIRRRYLKKKGDFTFVGTAWDIQIARYVFVFLQHHFRFCWRHRENRRLKNREAFLFGMALGICLKLEEENQQPEGEGLIHLDRAIALRKSYLAKLFPEMTDLDLDDNSEADSSKHAGYLAGRKTNIRPGVENAGLTRPALPPPVGQLTFPQ